MSHINEALKKAQKEKDARHLNYAGILFAGGKGRMGLGRRAFWGSLFLLLFILVAFTAYTWLNSKGPRTPPAHSKNKQAQSLARPKTSRTQTPTRSKQPPKPSKPALDANTLYERAKYFHKSGRLRDAKRFYQKALSLEPSHVDALNNLGVIYIHDKDYAAAQRSFDKAIQLKPSGADGHYNMACLYAIKGELSAGLTHLRKAVSLDGSAKQWARQDTDLANLRGVPEFVEIIGNK